VTSSDGWDMRRGIVRTHTSTEFSSSYLEPFRGIVTAPRGGGERPIDWDARSLRLWLEGEAPNLAGGGWGVAKGRRPRARSSEAHPIANLRTCTRKLQAPLMAGAMVGWSLPKGRFAPRFTIRRAS
jgi:hypothetical protein